MAASSKKNQVSKITTIRLTQKELDILDRLHERHGATYSQLIRSAIRRFATISDAADAIARETTLRAIRKAAAGDGR